MRQTRMVAFDGAGIKPLSNILSSDYTEIAEFIHATEQENAMLHNTGNLTETKLDYAVACLAGAEFKPNSIGANHAYIDGKYVGGFVTRNERGVAMPHNVFTTTRPAAYGSALVEQILESEIASFQRTDSGWCAVTRSPAKAIAHGETMRIAGLRAAVIAKFGASVDVPDWVA